MYKNTIRSKIFQRGANDFTIEIEVFNELGEIVKKEMYDVLPYEMRQDSEGEIVAKFIRKENLANKTINRGVIQ